MFKLTIPRVVFYAFLALLFLLLIRFLAFDLTTASTHKTVSFEQNGNTLQGTLILPLDTQSPPFVLLVHGDGPQDRWSNDGYIPLVNYLVSEGIAVFSWDKPGVGQSTGNWFSQTMSDRAKEAAAAMETIRQQPELQLSRGGYLGFSQAGWIVPYASQLTQTDFIALVGAAINWKQQGLYFMEERLTQEGRSAIDIAQAVKQESAAFDQQYTKANTQLPCQSLCNRKDFERINALSDARQRIMTIQSPVLLLMGEHDRNVNPDTSLTIWHDLLPQGIPQCIKKIPAATHGLLRSALFDYQLASEWPLWKQGLFVLLGEYAYAPGSLPAIAMWVNQQTCPNHWD